VSELLGRVLLVDDDEDIQTAGRLALGRHVERVVCCATPDELLAAVAEHGIDVVVLDMNYRTGDMSGADGLTWLDRIQVQHPEVVVIAATAYGSVDVAVEAMKRGAIDFVAKPWQNDKLVAIVRAALALRQSRAASPPSPVEAWPRPAAAPDGGAVRLPGPLPDDAKLYRAPVMLALLELVRRAAPTDANVLLLGENGAGKEVIAREVHRLSSRADRPFVSVDLGSVAEALFDSELFGHRKGAFTDAREDRLGRFQAASGGTLFLDEIGNLPLRLQAKLLTVLEQRVVTPVGDHRAVAIDVRVIAATNLAPAQLADPAVFRVDLLYRLNTVTLTVPALRDRPEDLEILAEHFARMFARKYRRDVPGVAGPALRMLRAYPWPGNVRELRHAVERAVIMSSGGPLCETDFQLGTIAAASAAAAPSSDDVLNLEEIEKDAILRALRKHTWNVSHAARELGLTRASLYRRMVKHGL
jgi:DNA-binding NtrC family response regulator